MDVARVNIGLARHPGFRDQIRIARRINHYLGENRMPAFLAFENCASYDAVLDDGCRAPRVQEEPHVDFAQHSQGERFERFRVDRGRPGDDAMIRGGPLCPVRSGCRIAAAPVLPRGSLDRVFGQAIHQFLGNATDHLLPGPIGHAIDPDHETTRREPA